MRAIEYFDKGADANPDRTAIIDGDSSYTYCDTRAITTRIARAMWAGGLRGERCAGIYSHNDARVLFCMLAIMRAGAIWVPINYRNAIDATVEYMNYVEMEWLFYHSNFVDSVAEIKRRVPTLRHFVCLDADDGGHPSLEKFVQQGQAGEERDWADAQGNIDRLVGLVPTGGTTGPAKGVQVTSLAWGTMTEMATHYWRGSAGDPVCLNTAPLSHAAGVVAFTMFTLGATNVILPKFDALTVLQSIEHHKITHLFLPPAAFYTLLAHPEVEKFDYSTLQVFLLAGSPVSPDKLKRGVEVFGPCLCQSYGQTEAPMLLTFLDSETLAAAASGDHPERLASCGKPTSAVRLAIMDEQGRILPRHEVGEIVARGTLVTAGYYKMPDATAEIRKYGWHHTGDVGYLDEDGYVFIVDRKKDMIKVGGENVYPRDVEEVLFQNRKVLDCVVAGVPDEKLVDKVKAYVVLKPGETALPEEIIDFCKGKLAKFKVPKEVEFRDSLPKNMVGKMLRRLLVEEEKQKLKKT